MRPAQASSAPVPAADPKHLADSAALSGPPLRLRRRLNSQDCTFYFLETEEAPMNIGSVAVFEGEVLYERFLQMVESKLHLIPRYCQRVVEAPFNVGRPTWEFDHEFDIRQHILPRRLEDPGTDEQLLQLAADIHRGRLRRDRPLWELHLVQGLEGGRSAIIAKIHHCLVDGVSGIELLMIIMDVSADPPPPPPAPEGWAQDPMPDPLTLFMEALFDDLSERQDRAAAFQKDVTELLLGDDPTRFRTIVRALETALPYLAVPMERAPFNGPFSGKREIACSEVSFQEARSVRKACGGTVNDVVLATLGGALCRYLEAHGQRVEGRTMRVATPVNVRREDERGTLGNRISMLAVDVPVGRLHPVQRLKAITARTEELKRGHIAEGLEAVVDLLGALPTPLLPLLAALPGPPNTLANMVCTNVPGPMIPLYTVGHRLLAHYPIVPIAWEMGVGCAVTSYNQKLYVGLIADRQAAPDVRLLKDCLDQAWVELRSAAGVERVEAAQEIGVQPARPAQEAVA